MFGRVLALAVTALAAGAASVGAQDGYNVASDREQDERPPLRVEDIYLRSNVTVDTLAAQIRTGDRDTRLLAIRSLEAQLDRGAVDPASPELYEALLPAVDEGVFTINHTTQRSLFIYDPMVRREAVRVMGLLGTERAQGKLLAIALNDPEPQVRATALRGIGTIAIDPDGHVSRSIARVILRERADTPHQESVLAAVNALGAISRSSENALDPSAREMLVQVASDGIFIQVVRKQALLVLANM